MTAPSGRPALGGRILVVDDKDTNRELLRQDLESEGFEVETAASGPDCLEKARTWAPWVVIMDIQMPGMDGIEACRRLKAEPGTAHIPVLFLTGHGDGDATQVAALRAGGNDFLSKPYDPLILNARVSSQVAIYLAHARLRELAIIDTLTGVYSRLYLFDSLAQEVKESTRSPNTSLACLMIDVDHFKSINDRHGHAGGDEVLRFVASTIHALVRGSDVVGRFGGEEFAVILPKTAPDDAVKVAGKICAGIAERSAGKVPVTVSIGVAFSDGPGGPSAQKPGGADALMDALLRRADEALYRAKREGRNRVCVAGGGAQKPAGEPAPAPAPDRESAAGAAGPAAEPAKT